ncbi:MAG TPA: rRNA maturation RNase YbeY [Bacillales bacterium]|nr:rRNA maturation RNase YbeY [Bacillales bacterium]
MMLDIDIHDETGLVTEEQMNTIIQLLQASAESEKIPDETEVSVTFVDDERIRELNRTYRDLDKSTDVLSFALQEESEDELSIVGEGLPETLGDIIISVQRAKEQAVEYQHSFMRELGFLAVHGFLHLCGYDHMNEVDEKEMFSRQNELLESYGLKR